MNKTISSLLLTVLCGQTLLLSGCGSDRAPVDPVSKQSFYFDTICQITIYDMEQMTSENASAAISAAFDACASYENILSKTKENSDIWNINHANGSPVVCSDDTITLLQDGIHYGDLTNGIFDISIGKAENLWDFHSDTHLVPSDEEIQNALSHIDYTKVQIEGNVVTLKDEDAEIDLGGIAKGYIADQIAESLKQDGVTSAVISLGGNIECVGAKPAANADSLLSKLFSSDETPATLPFVIGVETPYSDRSEISGTISLEDACAVTSGIYERYFIEDDTLYHHIIDPSTGYPAATDVVSVTVTGPFGHSSDCDALSTTCLLYGISDGLSLIESLDGYEAVFLDEEGNAYLTSGMNFSSD